MEKFARCFLLVFQQLYVGGFLALSLPPFHEIERGFFKSSAGVYLGAGLLALGGRVALLFENPSPTLTTSALIELALWAISVVGAAVYLRTLWSDAYRLRARAYVVAWMSGLLALSVEAQAFRLGPDLSVETVLYPLTFVTGALLLGSVSAGMLLGHWYLIDHDLSIDPFRRMFRFFAVMLVVQAALLLLTGMLLSIDEAGAEGLTALFADHSSLLTVRLLLSPIATAGLAWMIWKTLQIPQTMAATGLFYIAILSVLVGEFMGRFILFRTSLPL
jgi:hypothetical protein